MVVLLAAFSGASSPLIAQQIFRRTYKATAYVKLWSIPVFTRTEVGYGSAVEQRRPDRNGEFVELDFCSGSIPERAHGLNRFGYVHELVLEKDNVPVAADYIGAMTVGGNQVVKGGQAVFDVHTEGEVPYLAASEHIADHEARSRLRHISLPVPREPAMSDIIRRVRESWEVRNSAMPQEERSLTAETARTFLYSVWSAIRSSSPATRHEFIYVGKRYVLTTTKHSDTAAGTELQKVNLTPDATHIVRLNGTIDNLQTKERTDFAVWYEEGSDSALPLRFEFHPRPYLKLVFDAEAARPQPAALASRALLDPR